MMATDQRRHLDLALDAVDRLFQLQLHDEAEIRTATLTTTATATAAAEDVAKDVAEDIAQIRATRTAATTAAVQTGVAIAVVNRPLLGIAQHLVGLFGLLELVLCLWIIRIAIRMQLHGQTPKRLLQFVLGRTLLDTENFVVVAFGHGLRAVS